MDLLSIYKGTNKILNVLFYLSFIPDEFITDTPSEN